MGPHISDFFCSEAKLNIELDGSEHGHPEHAHAYEVRITHGTEGWQAAGVFTCSRPILIENPTPGTTYTMQARAIGGTTGYSDWSSPVSHMSM